MSTPTTQRIPVSGPWVTEKEVQYVSEAARTAWYANANHFNTKFEKAFADYVGASFAVALPSCTSAIHLALAAYGVGPGDEVIVPECTWIATAAPVQYVGATPVFADIDATTWCLDAESLRRAITPRTKAVIAVNLYGSMPDYDALRAVLQGTNIALIEDAAESVGSVYQGRNAGGLGDVGVFSFHGSKTLTTGEGGLLVTSREDIYKRVLFLRDHGRPPGDRYFYNTEVAYKYRMSSLQAAFGLAQLERVHELIGRKRDIFSWYQEELSALPGVLLNAEPAGVKNSYWMSTITWDSRYPFDKTGLMQKMDQAGVDTRPFFYPLSSLPAYEGSVSARNGREKNPVAYRIGANGINLPSALCLQKEQVQTVCHHLKQIFSS